MNILDGICTRCGKPIRYISGGERLCESCKAAKSFDYHKGDLDIVKEAEAIAATAYEAGRDPRMALYARYWALRNMSEPSEGEKALAPWDYEKAKEAWMAFVSTVLCKEDGRPTQTGLVIAMSGLTDALGEALRLGYITGLLARD